MRDRRRGLYSGRTARTRRDLNRLYIWPAPPPITEALYAPASPEAFEAPSAPEAPEAPQAPEAPEVPERPRVQRPELLEAPPPPPGVYRAQGFGSAGA